MACSGAGQRILAFVCFDSVMNHIDSDTLPIIPCCADKAPGGYETDHYNDLLSQTVSSKCYNDVISARAELLSRLKSKPKYLSNEYSKNKEILRGPDFGGPGISCSYLSAVDRYTGNLYSADPDFSVAIKEALDTRDKPKILVLSALYGPLHPLSLIQDYNLKMSDSLAYQTWKNVFAPFLEEYVNRNNIRSIYLYLGSSTAYFKVAKKAIDPLLKKGLLIRAVQYEVENGNAYHTPHNHGLRILSDLRYRTNMVYTRTVADNQL